MAHRVVRRLGPDGPHTVRLDLETGEHAASDEEPTHWLVRAPLNAHTHVGDAFLAGRVPDGDLASVVAPPDGFKHRELARAEPDVVIAGIRAALAEYARAGCRRIVDFREGGVDGVRLLGAALDEAPEAPAVTILGRPAGPADDVTPILARTDGLAFSSLADDADQDLEQIAAACHDAGGLFAIHLSEAVREDVEAALALEPDLLVHLCAASDEDIGRVAEADVPVAVCPSSNARFGLEPPIGLLEAHGVRWAFGTDNAMFGGRSLVAEAARVRATHPGVADERLVRALEAEGFEEGWGLPAGPAPPPLLLPIGSDGRIDWKAPAERPNTRRAMDRRTG